MKPRKIFAGVLSLLLIASMLFGCGFMEPVQTGDILTLGPIEFVISIPPEDATSETGTDDQPVIEIDPEASVQEQMVWIPASGLEYHSKASCSGMTNPTEVPLSEAEAKGYTACGRCW